AFRGRDALHPTWCPLAARRACTAGLHLPPPERARNKLAQPPTPPPARPSSGAARRRAFSRRHGGQGRVLLFPDVVCGVTGKTPLFGAITVCVHPLYRSVAGRPSWTDPGRKLRCWTFEESGVGSIGRGWGGAG